MNSSREYTRPSDVTVYQLFKQVKKIQEIFKDELKLRSFNHYNDEFDFIRHCIDEAQRFNEQSNGEVYGLEEF